MDILAGTLTPSVQIAAYTTATGAAATITSATAGLSLWYRRGVTGDKTAISPADLATLATAYAEGGLLVIGGAEHRLDLPVAAAAAGVDRVSWGGEATGITIDGGEANLIGQATTGSVGTPLTSVQTQAAAALGAATAITVAGVYTGTPPTADAIGTDAASKILATPANKLATNAGGEVTPTAASKTGYSLSATGLDAIADPDDLAPATIPTTFTQKLRWLIQRFWKADKSAGAITVKNEAGDVITTQAITVSGTDQTVEAPS